MNNDVKLTLVVPCYNEKDNLNKIIRKCQIITSNHPIKFILVDNGSTDGSHEIFNKLNNDKIKIHFVKKNVGYGHGILEGLKLSKSQFVGWTHADLQTDIEDVILSLKFIKKDENIFIKGLRKGRGFSDNVLTFLMSVLETIIFQTFLWDINSQPTIFNKKLLVLSSNPPHNFMLDLFFYVNAKKFKFKIKRFNVNFYKRQFGQSKWNYNFKNKFITIVQAIIYSINLRIR